MDNLVPQGGSQCFGYAQQPKSKVLYIEAFACLEWVVYLSRGVLVSLYFIVFAARLMIFYHIR